MLLSVQAYWSPVTGDRDDDGPAVAESEPVPRDGVSAQLVAADMTTSPIVTGTPSW